MSNKCFMSDYKKIFILFFGFFGFSLMGLYVCVFAMIQYGYFSQVGVALQFHPETVKK